MPGTQNPASAFQFWLGVALMIISLVGSVAYMSQEWSTVQAGVVANATAVLAVEGDVARNRQLSEVRMSGFSGRTRAVEFSVNTLQANYATIKEDLAEIKELIRNGN